MIPRMTALIALLALLLSGPACRAKRLGDVPQVIDAGADKQVIALPSQPPDPPLAPDRNGSEAAADDVEKQIMEPPSQPPPPPLEPDKNGGDATAEVESPHRSEAGRESPDPKKGVDWQFVGGVVAIIGIVVVVFFGWLQHKGSRETTAALEKIAENTAGIASKDPDEAAATAARVQREPVASQARGQLEPAASLVDRARADAILLQEEGKIEEALEKWRSIGNLVGEDRQLRALAWFAIGSLHSEGEGADLEASLDAYTRGIAQNPAFAEAYYTNRGTVKEDLNRPADAIADYSQAIALNPATEHQAQANETTEQGQRQERLKNAIEHLGHESASVRLGGAYELFHLQ